MSMLHPVLAMLLAGAFAGPPDDPEFDLGKAAITEKRYEDAAKHFEKAYNNQPDSLLLFLWAQAERKAGNCDEAVPLYRKYLALDPPFADVEVTRKFIKECGEDPDQVPPPPPEPDDDPEGDLDGGGAETTDPPSSGTGRDDSPRPPFRDPLGHVLTWSGIVVLGVGTGLLSEAHGRKRAALEAPNEPSFGEEIDGAPMLSRVGVGVMIGGGVLLAAGVVRFTVLAVKARRSKAAVALPQGPGLSWKFDLAPRRSWALR